MLIKERIFIQDIIKKIESNRFSENDVYVLFLLLRQNINYGASFYEDIIYELSNFAAHINTRYKGLMIDNFKDFYHVSLYYFKRLAGEINLTDEFPSFIKEICLRKLNKMDAKTVKDIFGDNKEIIRKAIDKAIIYSGDNNVKIDKSAPRIMYNIMSDLLSMVPADPMFTDEDIIKSILKILDMNSINYNKKELLKQKEKIIMSLLVLIHHTNIDNNLGIKIHCHIYYNIETNNLSLNLGYLIPDNDYVGFMYEAISTKLNINDYCSDEFINKHNIDLIEKNGSVFNSELGLNNEFKLEERFFSADRNLDHPST